MTDTPCSIQHRTDPDTISDLCDTKGKKIIYWNARSLLANFNLFELDVKNSNFLALCISETWLNTSLPNSLIAISGYNIIRLDRVINKRGGGLLLYINDQFDFDIAPDHLNVSNANLELLSVKVKIPNQRDFVISTVYLPPSGKKIEALQMISNNIEEFCKTIKTNAVVVLGGDFNLNYAVTRDGIGSDRELLLEFGRKNGFSQVISSYTRTTVKSCKTIDLIFTNNIDLMYSSGVIPYNVSDHDLVYIVYKKPISKCDSTSFTFRSLRDYNLAILYHRLNAIDWTDFYQSSDPSTCWKIMHENFLATVNVLAPFVEKKNVPSRNDWVDDDSIQKIKKRDALRAKLIYFRDNEELSLKYKEARNSARQAVNVAKGNSVKDTLTRTANNPKKFWGNLKKLMPGKKDLSKSPSNIILKDNNGILLTNELETSNQANNFFVNVGPELASKIPDVNRDDYYKALEISEENTEKILNFPVLTLKKTETILKSIDTNKSSNIPGIENRIFKDCLLCTIPQVCFLYNLILISCSIPEVWKQAIVVPLF